MSEIDRMTYRAARTSAALTTFGVAMALQEAARAKMDAYDHSCFFPALKAAEHGDSAVPDGIDGEAERLTDAWREAQERMIAMPAPNIAATIWKIEAARERWAGFTDWPGDWWEAIMRDLRQFEAILKEAA